MAQIYNIDESFDYSLFDNASCAFGVFDGVHKGHRYLLECARETARKDNGKSIALTFDIDPDELFPCRSSEEAHEQRAAYRDARTQWADAVAVLHFTREFAALSPLDFLNQTFKGFVPAHLHVGLDFHFGAKAAGSVRPIWGSGLQGTSAISMRTIFRAKMACLSPLRAFVTCLLNTI